MNLPCGKPQSRFIFDALTLFLNMPDFYFNPYALPPLIAGLLIFTFGIFVWIKKIHSSVNLYWFLVCVSMTVWVVADYFLFSTKNIKTAEFFSKIVYVGVTAIPIFSLCFTLKIVKLEIPKLLFAGLFFFYASSLYFEFNSRGIITGVHDFFWGYYPAAGKFHAIWLFIWSLIFISCLIILRIKRSTPSISPQEKNRIDYVFFILLAGAIVGPIDFIPKYGIEFYPLGYFCIPLMVAIMTYAMLKHNLLDIKIVLKQSLLYSILIACLTAIYLLLIMLTELIFRDIFRYKSVFLSLGSAFIIAILFNPLRNRLQNFIDRIFLGKAPQEIVAENILLKQELEHSERLKTASALALGLAHEIKNPITTINTFAEYLPERLDDKEFLTKFSKLIPAETERINNIIQQLLRFSKPSPPKFQQIRIHQIIQDTLSLLNSEFLKRKIKLFELYDNREISINADPEQIKQVLINILFNAMEAMPQGGTISIETREQNSDFLEISIKDEGCGIAKEDLKHVFDPFFSKKESGTGLGLAITHQIIKNHCGKIKVESEVNKGTDFKIYLPFKSCK